MINKKARVIALYLPQYHPIPENDKWWGKGFTEWTNVGNAKPLFKGHYQPRVPADLGYYDLRLPEIREAQAELARDAGVEGFMYWHYWFGNEKLLLEKPFQEVLKSGKPAFPFCLAWANHSWENKTWNPDVQKKKSQMLIEQIYPGKHDYIAHFNYVLPAFRDKRYICIDEKPVFYIYSPNSIPDCKLFIDTWQELAQNEGFNGIHFIGKMDTWLKDYDNLKNMGFDAINTITNWHAQCKITGKLFNRIIINLKKYLKLDIMQVYNYADIIKHLSIELDRKEDVYPTIIPQFDHSPRSKKFGIIYHGSTPELFRQHVHNAVSAVSSKMPENRVIFLRSWNEWAEGNYVEPDLVFGNGYLNALKKELAL